MKIFISAVLIAITACAAGPAFAGKRQAAKGGQSHHFSTGGPYVGLKYVGSVSR